MHVHVAHPDGEAKFWLLPEVRLANHTGLSGRKLLEACPAEAVSQPTIPNSDRNPRPWLKRTLRRFAMPGASTLTVEVTHVSRHGFWLMLDGEELLLPFADFPWFRQATIEQLSDVSWPSPDHLYWPQLDVDLSLASIRDPGAFPLVAKS